MTTTYPKAPAQSLSSLPIWRISVDRYHALLASGFLTEKDNLELLEGYLTEKMTINPPHSHATRVLRKWLYQYVTDECVIFSQEPLTLSDSEPEPDLMVANGTFDRFVTRNPYAHEVTFLVEVADSSLQTDQIDKHRIYARAGIAVYWIVNIPECQVEVYTRPSGPGANPTYQQVNIYLENDSVPVLIDGQEIGKVSVAELFPSNS